MDVSGRERERERETERVWAEGGRWAGMQVLQFEFIQTTSNSSLVSNKLNQKINFVLTSEKADTNPRAERERTPSLARP